MRGDVDQTQHWQRPQTVRETVGPTCPGAIRALQPYSRCNISDYMYTFDGLEGLARIARTDFVSPTQGTRCNPDGCAEVWEVEARYS
jgi:hypothetical protein